MDQIRRVMILQLLYFLYLQIFNINLLKPLLSTSR